MLRHVTSTFPAQIRLPRLPALRQAHLHRQSNCIFLEDSSSSFALHDGLHLPSRRRDLPLGLRRSSRVPRAFLANAFDRAELLAELVALARGSKELRRGILNSLPVPPCNSFGGFLC